MFRFSILKTLFFLRFPEGNYGVSRYKIYNQLNNDEIWVVEHNCKSQGGVLVFFMTYEHESNKYVFIKDEDYKDALEAFLQKSLEELYDGK
jgi:hypothetical protein